MGLAELGVVVVSQQRMHMTCTPQQETSDERPPPPNGLQPQLPPSHEGACSITALAHSTVGLRTATHLSEELLLQTLRASNRRMAHAVSGPASGPSLVAGALAHLPTAIEGIPPDAAIQYPPRQG